MRDTSVYRLTEDLPTHLPTYLPPSNYLSIIHRSICYLPIYRATDLSFHLSVCLSTYLSSYRSTFPSICLSTYHSISLSISLSISPSTSLSIYLSTSLSLSLSASVWLSIGRVLLLVGSVLRLQGCSYASPSSSLAFLTRKLCTLQQEA